MGEERAVGGSPGLAVVVADLIAGRAGRIEIHGEAEVGFESKCVEAGPEPLGFDDGAGPSAVGQSVDGDARIEANWTRQRQP